MNRQESLLWDEMHWYEGLFLRPHHLQILQRSFGDALRRERRLQRSFSHGLVERQISTDSLQNNLIQFDRLLAIMPSGTIVSFPGNADLQPLDCKAGLDARAEVTILLGVPRWDGNRANLDSDKSAAGLASQGLYRLREAERYDENTGEGAQPVLLRRINARLLLEGEDVGDLETIPLLRVQRGGGEGIGLPRERRDFIPPSLTVRAADGFYDGFRDLVNQVQASLNDLVAQIRSVALAPENLRAADLQTMLHLSVLSRYGGRWAALLQDPGLSPFDLYTDLCECLGSLQALTPRTERADFQVPAYNHDRPSLWFFDLVEEVRARLRRSPGRQPYSVAFNRENAGLVAALASEHFEKVDAYYLGIRTAMPAAALKQLVEDPNKFKVMSRSRVMQPIFGIRAEFEPKNPAEFPTEKQLHYVRLYPDRNPDMWATIQREKLLALRWQNWEQSDFVIKLYMPLAREDAAAARSVRRGPA